MGIILYFILHSYVEICETPRFQQGASSGFQVSVILFCWRYISIFSLNQNLHFLQLFSQTDLLSDRVFNLEINVANFVIDYVAFL